MLVQEPVGRGEGGGSVGLLVHGGLEGGGVVERAVSVEGQHELGQRAGGGRAVLLRLGHGVDKRVHELALRRGSGLLDSVRLHTGSRQVGAQLDAVQGGMAIEGAADQRLVAGHAGSGIVGGVQVVQGVGLAVKLGVIGSGVEIVRVFGRVHGKGMGGLNGAVDVRRVGNLGEEAAVQGDVDGVAGGQGRQDGRARGPGQGGQLLIGGRGGTALGVAGLLLFALRLLLLGAGSLGLLRLFGGLLGLGVVIEPGRDLVPVRVEVFGDGGPGRLGGEQQDLREVHRGGLVPELQPDALQDGLGGGQCLCGLPSALDQGIGSVPGPLAGSDPHGVPCERAATGVGTLTTVSALRAPARLRSDHRAGLAAERDRFGLAVLVAHRQDRDERFQQVQRQVLAASRRIACCGHQAGPFLMKVGV